MQRNCRVGKIKVECQIEKPSLTLENLGMEMHHYGTTLSRV